MDYFAESNRKRLTLKRGRERAISNRHPWIFAGAIASERGPENAAIADLYDDGGALLASGLYSGDSQIRLRALVFGERLAWGMLEERLSTAVSRRASILNDATNAARLINSEGDDLSGLIVDQYDDLLVVEIANRGLELLRPLVLESLQRLTNPRVIHFKNDVGVRKLEKLTTEPESIGEGDPAADIVENALRFHVDAAEGQKTGFFLDQRENRLLARGLGDGKRCLNLFSYTGGFGVYAGAGGAAGVENVDVSEAAIALARRNHEANGIDADFVVADAFQYVRAKSAAKNVWDLIICDPPAFAKSRGDIDRAARGYKDINLYAIRLAAPGAKMMTFSCSGHLSLDLFQKIIFSAALDAGRRVSFLRRLTAGPDHPISLNCPEGEYLKGFLLEIT